MTNNSAATFELRLEEGLLKNLNLKSLEKLKDILSLYKVSFNTLALAVSTKDDIEFDFLTEDTRKDELEALAMKREEEILSCYKSFQEEFKEKTGIGVELAYSNEHEEGFYSLNFWDIFEEKEASKKLGGLGKLFNYFYYND